MGTISFHQITLKRNLFRCSPKEQPIFI
uniref:Uncharacterized protein n=1 Tax=Anguilla anguilla TaxID=7936 RepID=A0A0E9QKQ6_ANGAN